MPRKPRRRSKSGFYHIMLRGSNRQIIFENDDDKYRFLLTLRDYADASKYNVFAYCLMDNHVHILLQELEDDISTAIKRISASYVFWFNKKYERCGHLFQERFKSEVVEGDNYLITVLRYIHQNPVKANLCKKPIDYKWTSYKEYVTRPDFVETNYCLNLFSPERVKAIDLFVKFMNEDNEDSCLEDDEFNRVTDADLIQKLYEMGVRSIGEFQHYSRENRNEILKELKGINGVSVRQISRITGISKSLISKLK